MRGASRPGGEAPLCLRVIEGMNLSLSLGIFVFHKKTNVFYFCEFLAKIRRLLHLFSFETSALEGVEREEGGRARSALILPCHIRKLYICIISWEERIDSLKECKNRIIRNKKNNPKERGWEE